MVKTESLVTVLSEHTRAMPRAFFVCASVTKVTGALDERETGAPSRFGWVRAFRWQKTKKPRQQLTNGDVISKNPGSDLGYGV